ncbi:hypothetical protein Poly51_21290 [Rubripirellula tenax]|uniref:Autotransporter-associated beta strand repeat protein n=1 Tax=Rubripirellula tenax TaxID=2528015 RepID=A0A5C6FI71_9BACT|nr:hypothetical protein [Rubripirellula tenax]TWU59341.1 hypothetical protein Poly51_21290 [Rubripirellula tenax]
MNRCAQNPYLLATFLMIGIAIAEAPGIAFGQMQTWNVSGSGSGLWSNAANWTPGQVPTQSSNVFIPGFTTSGLGNPNPQITSPAFANQVVANAGMMSALLEVRSTLTVGNGGMILNNQSTNLLGNLGGRVVVNGDIQLNGAGAAESGATINISSNGTHTQPILDVQKLTIGGSMSGLTQLSSNSQSLSAAVPIVRAQQVFVGSSGMAGFSSDALITGIGVGTNPALTIGSSTGSGLVDSNRLSVNGNIKMGVNGSGGSMGNNLLQVSSNGTLTAGNADIAQGNFTVSQNAMASLSNLTLQNEGAFQTSAGSSLSVAGKILQQQDSVAASDIGGTVSANQVELRGTTNVNVGGTLLADSVNFESESNTLVKGSVGTDANRINALSVNGGNFSIDGTSSNTGKVFAGDLTLSSGEINDTTVSNMEVGNGVHAASLNVSGTTTIDGIRSHMHIGQSGMASLNDLVLNNGSIEVGGHLTINGSMTVDAQGYGAIRTYASGMLTISSLNLNEGTLQLGGNMTGDITQVGGILAPGQSPGLLDLVGNYSLNSGILQMELGGANAADFDRLKATSITLGGTSQLEVVWYNGFEAALGNQFDILDFTTINGTFSSMLLPTLSNGLLWNSSALYTTGVLSVVSASAVPELSSSLMLAMGGLTVCFVHRRRTRRCIESRT